MSDWQSIAEDLAAALQSFTAYDGYGEGGAADSNRGDWERADAALDRFHNTEQEETNE